MYHEYKKNSRHVREALYKVYGEKCAYCGESIKYRNMQVDHILPTNGTYAVADEDTKKYIDELMASGFIKDSLENYLPTCASCNRIKSNQIYSAPGLVVLFEMARKNLKKVLRLIHEAERKGKSDYIYEPVDLSVWEEVTFEHQRDISHAIMGYRLTSADVVSCPEFPQVHKTEEQLDLVDYAVIQGETGCGKSISLFQVAHRLFMRGWKVYAIRHGFEQEKIFLPDNTENSLYLIDDAQIYTDASIMHIQDQARKNRKVLFGRTISEKINSDSIILTKKDAVNILYKDFLNRKAEILPVVARLDNTVGTHFLDLPIEQRLEEAKSADSPWQFTYVLRGGWRSMRETYKSIGNHKDCDLLAATIAAFQIMQLDKPADFGLICERVREIDSKYRWTDEDLAYLIKKSIIISEQDVRIVHLESASVILALFFDEKKNEKQSLLIRIIEDSFLNNEISPLGIVWLCNGCRRYLRWFRRPEDLFITDRIIEGVTFKLYEQAMSEETRDIMYLINKILTSGNKEKGVEIIQTHENRILELANKADGTSAWGFEELLNSLFNYDRKAHNSFSRKIAWKKLIEKMTEEQHPNYYAWGRMFNRGLVLLGEKQYSVYSGDMYKLVEKLILTTGTYNIEGVTNFICDVWFLFPAKIHKMLPKLLPIYKQCFIERIEQLQAILSYDFICRICGIDFWTNRRPMPEQEKTAKAIVDAIPIKELANYISNSEMYEWISIRYVLYFIYYFDKDKYKAVINHMDFNQLANMTKNSWERSYEVSMVIEHIAMADNALAKAFVTMNTDYITVFYPAMIIVDPDSAIKLYAEKKAEINIFADNNWVNRNLALKALLKADKEVAIEYLRKNKKEIIEVYSNVTALDFVEGASLDILKIVEKLDAGLYDEIILKIDREKVRERWDQCGGIPSRKKQWVKKRKECFFSIINLQM